MKFIVKLKGHTVRFHNLKGARVMFEVCPPAKATVFDSRYEAVRAIADYELGKQSEVVVLSGSSGTVPPACPSGSSSSKDTPNQTGRMPVPLP